MAGNVSLINQQTTPQIIQNQTMPKEGPRALTFNITFAASTTYEANLIQFISKGAISLVQGAYVDNSANPNNLAIFNPATGQTVQWPAYYQGYLPILALNPADLFISSAGSTASVVVILYNVPIAPAIWPAVGPGSQGTIPVSDAILDATVSAGKVNVLPSVLGGADAVQKVHKANQTVSIRATTAASTTLLTGSPSFFIDWVDVRISGTATLSVAGITNVSLVDDTGPTTIMQADIYIPAAALNSSEIIVFDIPPGMNWVSAGAASHLKLVLSTALNGGSIIANLGAGTTAG